MKTQPLLDYMERHISLSETDKDAILSGFKLKRYQKGQYIVQSGNVCKHLSYVLSGCLKTSFLNLDGKEHIVTLAIEDWWVSDLGSFTEQTPADFDIKCLEDTLVLQIELDELERLFNKIPKLERFFRIIILRTLIFSHKRIRDNLSFQAKDRYLRFLEQYPQLEHRVPQYLIASYLGMSKEFLSKIRKELAMER